MSVVIIDESKFVNKFAVKMTAARRSLSCLLDVLHLFINYIPSHIYTSKHPISLIDEFIPACDRVVDAINSELDKFGIKPEQG